MRLLFILLAMSACSREPKSAPYFFSATIEQEDGSTLTITYSGDEPPEKVFPSLCQHE